MPANPYPADLLKIPGVAFDISIADPRDRIQAYLDAYKTVQSPEPTFDDELMRKHIKLISATSTAAKTACTFSLTPGQALSSRLGTTHGGALALLFDICTSMCAAPLARKGFWEFGGVSRTLSVTFMRPALSGREILIECEVLQIGRRLATIRGQMRDKATGTLLSVAEHNKASVDFTQDKAVL